MGNKQLGHRLAEGFAYGDDEQAMAAAAGEGWYGQGGSSTRTQVREWALVRRRIGFIVSAPDLADVLRDSVIADDCVQSARGIELHKPACMA